MQDKLVIHKTTDYFNISLAEAAKYNGYDTKEEALVLDTGTEHCFFETLEGVTMEFHSPLRKEYTRKNEYEVMIFEFVADNDNHNKYCMVFI